MSKKRIALYQNILADRYRRGPDIFFPTFFQEYTASINGRFELFYFIKTDNPAALLEEYEGGELRNKRVIFLKERHNRFKVPMESLALLWALLKYRINIFQVLTFTYEQDPLNQLKWLQWLAPVWRIRRAFVVTYDGIPTAHRMGYAGRHKNDRKYEKLFGTIDFHGILSWYADFEPWAETSGVFKRKPVIHAINSRFCNTEKYHPLEKRKEIIWASALVSYKGPLMFIEAVAQLHQEAPDLFDGWKVNMYGEGPLEEEVHNAIQASGLQHIVTMQPGVRSLAPLLNHSMAYVSTQELENFPSLAMNEAMAAGNIILALNVGRTHLFVEENRNGFLAESEDARGIAVALQKFLLCPERHPEMMRHSRELCKTVHTPENFIRQVDRFWDDLV